MAYKPKKGIDPLVRKEFSKLGKKGYEARVKKILEKSKVAKQNNQPIKNLCKNKKHSASKK